MYTRSQEEQQYPQRCGSHRLIRDGIHHGSATVQKCILVFLAVVDHEQSVGKVCAGDLFGVSVSGLFTRFWLFSGTLPFPLQREQRVGGRPILKLIGPIDFFADCRVGGGGGLPVIPLSDRSPRPVPESIGPATFRNDRTDHSVSPEPSGETAVLVLDEVRSPDQF